MSLVTPRKKDIH